MSTVPARSRLRSSASRLMRGGLIAAAAGLGAVLVAPAGEALALNVAQDRVVSADPANWTPDVVSSGSVRALAQTGSTMVAGGAFNEVRSPGDSTVLTRRNLFSFDATNGQVTPGFHPDLDGMVRALAISGSNALFVGGAFRQVNGVSQVSLTKLNLADGSLASGFTVPRLDGRIFTMVLANGRLLIGGTFTHVGGRAIGQLAALDPVTGAVDPSFHASFTGANNPANPGFRMISKMDISPDGTRLVAVGNFMQVNGADRPQIAMFDISGGAATLANWQTNRYRAPCSADFTTYLRDIDFSPDGSYFAVVTSGGGYTGHDQTVGCDSVARWQTAAGTALRPRWIQFTGNDSLHSVAVTGAAVYTGGHNRWINNPFGSDFAGPGAVERRGLAALEPATGLALPWNPGRTLGVGVFDLYATQAGLWIGHDTNTVGHESHDKVAFFPLI